MSEREKRIIGKGSGNGKLPGAFTTGYKSDLEIARKIIRSRREQRRQLTGDLNR